MMPTRAEWREAIVYVRWQFQTLDGHAYPTQHPQYKNTVVFLAKLYAAARIGIGGRLLH